MFETPSNTKVKKIKITKKTVTLGSKPEISYSDKKNKKSDLRWKL